MVLLWQAVGATEEVGLIMLPIEGQTGRGFEWSWPCWEGYGRSEGATLGIGLMARGCSGMSREECGHG